MLDVKSKLRSGHDFIAMAALDKVQHVVQDDSLLQKCLHAPFVGLGELNEDDMTDLVKTCIMFLHALTILALKTVLILQQIDSLILQKLTGLNVIYHNW